MERPAIIHKSASDLRVSPNLPDDTATHEIFSWAGVRSELEGLPGGGLNIAHEAVDRHARGARRDHIAFRFLNGDAVRDVSFGELARLSNRFANVLRRLGVGKGQRLFVLTGRIPELYLAVLGGFKNGFALSVTGAVVGEMVMGGSGLGTVLIGLTVLLLPAYNNTAFYPSKSHLQSSLTIYNASSSPYTLKVMTYVALGIPFVLAYVAYVWWAMNRTKIKIEDTGDRAAY